MISDDILIKARKLYTKAISLNYSHASAIGVCANVMAESNFDESVVEVGGGGGFGLGQWTPEENLYTQGAILGYSRAECAMFDVQVDILLRGDETGQWSNLAYDYDELVISPMMLDSYKTQLDILVATMNYMAHWERPSEDPNVNHKELRKQYALQFNELLSGGTIEYPHLPVEEDSVITSPYGMRIDPITGVESFHAGTDFSGGLDSKIYATMTGIVLYCSFNAGGLGNVIWIKHDLDPYYSAYAHLNSFNVTEGERVNRGQWIGGMGTSGESTGIHLHFVVATEIWGNLPSNTIDPEIYLQTGFNPVNPKTDIRKKIETFLLLDLYKNPYR